MRGERHEVRHQLVRALECDPALVLLFEETHAVERDAGERGDRAERRELLVAEERRIGRRPDDERRAGLVDADDLGALGRDGILARFDAGERRRSK